MEHGASFRMTLEEHKQAIPVFRRSHLETSATTLQRESWGDGSSCDKEEMNLLGHLSR